MNKETIEEHLQAARNELDYVADEVADLTATIDEALAVVEDEEATDEERLEVLEDVAARFHAESEAVSGSLTTALNEVEEAAAG